MMVDVDIKWLKELKPDAKVITDAIRWKETGRFKLDLRMLSDEEHNKLVEIAARLKGNGYQALPKALETFRMMKENPSGLPIKDLKALEAALIEHFLKTPNKWVFHREEQHRLPYYVTNVRYHPTVREEGYVTPEHTTMELESQDAKITIRWDKQDLDGGRWLLAKLLQNKRLKTEDEKLVAAYHAEMELYRKYRERVGDQFSATGVGWLVSTSWYSSGHTTAMDRDGVRSKVVIDDGSEPQNERRNSSNRTTTDDRFWNTKADPKRAGNSEEVSYSRKRGYGYRSTSHDDDDAEKDNVVLLPEHPWIRVFDLAQHEFLDIHVNDLEPYEFDDTLADKLILPPNTLEVLDALVRGADRVMEDIVKGKTGGTIVVCTGEPGTGKTLSAEVFAEKMHKPLYVVQCSQLGLDAEDLEKQLGIVLARANRWKCILLIDEADVYVRSRGEDIQQNAMVGVWLRLLEYYRGVMFLTSNRATIIDDAVMSRATAWIRYPRPDKEGLARIWAVLLAQYEMETPTSLIPMLVDRWPKATGRNVKNLIKLARQLGMADVTKEPMALFEMAGQFLDIEEDRQ